MSKNRPPMSAPQPQQINIDLSKATDITCDNCGNMTFEDVFMMKHLSAILSPTGKAGNVPIPTFACVSCGYVNEDFLPPFMRQAPAPAPVPPAVDAPEQQNTPEPPTPAAPIIEIVR